MKVEEVHPHLLKEERMKYVILNSDTKLENMLPSMAMQVPSESSDQFLKKTNK